MTYRQYFPTQDWGTLGVLEYQIAKILDQEILESVAALVTRIGEELGSSLVTEDETLYRLPSGAYAEVEWKLASVSEHEASLRISEAQD